MIWEFMQRCALCDPGAAVGGIAQGAGAVGAAALQASATNHATDVTAQTAANSLAFNKNVYDTTLTNEQPYQAAGASAVGQLQSGLSDGSLTAGYAPQFSFSGVNEANDPAYQWDLQQGTDAVQRSAAATGGLVSGGALKDLTNYSQGLASNQYQQSYSNALAQYQQAYNQYETTQSNTFNRLSSTAGLGQNAVTGTATSGNAAAGINANVNTNTANSLSNLATNQGNAWGAAAIGVGNGAASISNALSNGSSYNQPDANTPTWNSSDGSETYPTR